MGEIDAGGTGGLWSDVTLAGATGGGCAVDGAGTTGTAVERVIRIDCLGVAMVAVD